MEYLARRLDYYCPIALEKYGLNICPDALHHARKHNTKPNQKKYPRFLNSMLNLMAVKNDPYHLANPSFGAWRGDVQADKWEKFLSEPRHKKCYLLVTGQFEKLT